MLLMGGLRCVVFGEDRMSCLGVPRSRILLRASKTFYRSCCAFILRILAGLWFTVRLKESRQPVIEEVGGVPRAHTGIGVLRAHIRRRKRQKAPLLECIVNLRFPVRI